MKLNHKYIKDNYLIIRILPLILIILTANSCKSEENISYYMKKVEFSNNLNNQIISLSIKKKIEEITTQLIQLKFSNQNNTSHNKIPGGNIVLFTGASRKEKTYTAMFIGKSIGMDIYKIDLSRVVSKYIGETEKNISALFNRAEDKDWILFFDEADALFGQRTEIKDAHDRYANVEISYLLQRIEDFPGLVILASNRIKENDGIFINRIKYSIDFTRD